MPLDPNIEAIFQERERVSRERQLPLFESLREQFIEDHLARIGFSSLESKADWERVPDVIRKAIPEELNRSFGLVGGYGIGKTMGIAAAIKRHVRAGLATRLERIKKEGSSVYLESCVESGSLCIPSLYLWINWPGDSVSMRNKLFENSQDVEDWVLRAMDPTLRIVLDDIGAESVAGQDWTGQTLARILDERLRQQGLTFWTSNLNSKGLIERYGPRTFSRLQGHAPAIALPKMQDLRVRTQTT